MKTILTLILSLFISVALAQERSGGSGAKLNGNNTFTGDNTFSGTSIFGPSVQLNNGFTSLGLGQFITAGHAQIGFYLYTGGGSDNQILIVADPLNNGAKGFEIQDNLTGYRVLAYNGTNSNVGIGTSNPVFKFHVNGTNAANGYVSLGSTTTNQVLPTGWTNTLGANAQVRVTGNNVVISIKSAANTVLDTYTLSNSVVYTLRTNQAITAASGLTGTAWLW